MKRYENHLHLKTELKHFFLLSQGLLCGIVTSMVVILSLTVNTHYHMVHYDIIPTSIDGCTNQTDFKFETSYVFDE